MIKVMIERHLKEGGEIQSQLRELRAAAIHFPGYITGETLISTEDSSTIITISTWDSLDRWRTWAASGAKAKLYQKTRSYLLAEPIVRTFDIVATERPSD